MADLTLLDLLDRQPAPSHRGDPDTSREAAAKVKVGAVARKVIAALARAGEHGMTMTSWGSRQQLILRIRRRPAVASWRRLAWSSRPASVAIRPAEIPRSFIV